MENTQNTTTITVVDLDLLRNIIDLACTRGAFRGAEVAQVGTVYNKLTAFLESVIAQAQAQEAANVTADSEAATGADSTATVDQSQGE